MVKAKVGTAGKKHQTERYNMSEQIDNDKELSDHIDHYANIDDDEESVLGASIFISKFGFSVEDVVGVDEEDIQGTE